LRHRGNLGTLLNGPMIETYSDFTLDVMGCCARILAFCDNADLCFVGRSPENLFDHLSGLLSDSIWSHRLQSVQFSWRKVDEDRISSHALAALRTYFETMRLDPVDLPRRAHPVAFVDLVDSGETLGNLVSFVDHWVRQQGVDWKAVKSKFRDCRFPRKKLTSKATHLPCLSGFLGSHTSKEDTSPPMVM